MIRLGITGSRHGLSQAQRMAFAELLCARWRKAAALPPRFSKPGNPVLDHGDCLGADMACHNIALALGWEIHVHPPLNPKLRAHCQGYTVSVPPREYHARNRDIVKVSQGMIVLPNTWSPFDGSGTWWTARYACHVMHRPVTVILPNGKMVSGKTLLPERFNGADYIDWPATAGALT